jgi:hypothetical protein
MGGARLWSSGDAVNCAVFDVALAKSGSFCNVGRARGGVRSMVSLVRG